MTPFYLPLFAVLCTANLIPRDTTTTTCNNTTLNTTSYYYTVQETDTIFSIASTTSRGACDIARTNRMIDAEHLFPGFSLIIPPQVCKPDHSSCLLTRQNATAVCVNGGPHDYTTIAGDTVERIALFKLNITLESLLNKTATLYNITDPYEVLPAGTAIKIPQCMPSACTLTPYQFTYGVYKDIAEQFGTSVGQIMTLNLKYNYSSAVGTQADEALGISYPIISVPMGCTALSGSVESVI